MKKILLTAIFALLGLSAFAALPQAGEVGYLYNPASGKFIGAEAKLADEGLKFTIEIKDKDKNATPSVEGALFMRFKTGSNYLTFLQQPAVLSTFYGQLIVKETEKGLLITHPYPNDQGPDWITAGSYLQVVDGELACVALDEANAGAYWKYVDEDTYKKIAGPTYPIALTGATNDLVVEYTDEPYAGTFTPVNDLSNAFQHKPFDVKDFVAYGYKYIVVEFAEPVADGWNLHAYGVGNEPFFSLTDKTMYVVEMTDADVIEDFTIFNWFGCRAPLKIKACYFSKTKVDEPTPEPTPAVFPEFGAQGFLYNPESGLIVNASATLVSKAEINKETDILTVWQKGTESYSATRVRIATGKTDDVWTSLRVKDGEEGAYTIGFINDGYSRMTLEAGPEEGSYYINNTYNTGGESSHPGYIKANVEDGSLTIATEKDVYCVWKFLTEEEFDALATRISSVEKQPATQAIFNIAGQQIKALQKGLNIVNGKKIMVK